MDIQRLKHLKRCSKCKENKPLTEFGKQLNKYRSSCKKCINIDRIERYNKEKLTIQDHAFANKEHEIDNNISKRTLPTLFYSSIIEYDKF